MRGIFLCLCLWAVLATTSYAQQCARDYECGNVPRTICIGGADECSTTIEGLGVDVINNRVYFAQVCRADNGGQLPPSNITFKRVDANGGVAEVIHSRSLIPGPVNPSVLFDVIGNDLFFSIRNRSPGQRLIAHDLSSHGEHDVDTGAAFQSVIDFDRQNSLTFACNSNPYQGPTNYTIDRYEGILGQTVSGTGRQILYQLGDLVSCSAVRKQESSTDLYFATQEYVAGTSNFVSKLYKGSSNCFVNSCHDAPLPLISISNLRIADFDVDASGIFYGTINGVYKYNFAGGNVQTISSSGATGIRILGSRVYWNSGTAIFSTDLNGGDVKQVNSHAGTCGCREGYSGDRCSVCSGQEQWGYDGVPSCVPLNEDGNPVTCRQDYQCKNNPYSWCLGTCLCRPGLTGPLCDRCADSTQTITWVNGLPTCQ